MKEEARDREREGEERRDFGTVPCTLQRLPCSLELLCAFQRQGPAALMLPSLPPPGSTLTSKSVWISLPRREKEQKSPGIEVATNANLFGRGWRVRAPIFRHGNAIFGPGLRIQMRPWPGAFAQTGHTMGREGMWVKGGKFNKSWKIGMVGKYAREKLIRFDREKVISVFFFLVLDSRIVRVLCIEDIRLNFSSLR